MKYTITITKVEEVPVVKRGAYTIIDRRPWTEQELDNERQYCFGEGKEKWLAKNPLKDVLGYAPDVEVIENKETKVLEQTVESLDIPAVIKAINGL